MIIKEEEMNLIRKYRYKRGIGERQKEGQKYLNAVFIYEVIQVKRLSNIWQHYSFHTYFMFLYYFT